MALAKKCDRCGKLYEHYPTGNKPQYNSIQMLPTKHYSVTKYMISVRSVWLL